MRVYHMTKQIMGKGERCDLAGKVSLLMSIKPLWCQPLETIDGQWFFRPLEVWDSQLIFLNSDKGIPGYINQIFTTDANLPHKIQVFSYSYISSQYE